MKILLINTPRSPFNGILEYAPKEASYFIHKKLIGPPLGLLTLAAAVKEHDVVVFDTKGEYDLNPDTPPLSTLVENLIRTHKPDIVCTTVISSEFYYGLEILKTTKSINSDITTIIGGLHVTLCIENCNDPSVDIAIRGHAAHQLREIVKAKESGHSFQAIEGIYINTPKGLIPTKPMSKLWDAAGKDFLMVDRSQLKRWKETYKVPNAPSPTTYIFTSLGCPYQCSFCSIWREYCGSYYKRNIESIIEELKNIDYDIVRFADANTIVDVSFIDNLFTRIEEEGIKKEYIMDIRADTAVGNPKLIEKLARNGLKVVICGFESYKEAELEKYNKKSSAFYIENAIKLFHDNGIMLRGNYVIPTSYTHADFRAMADYAGQHKVAYAGYTILTPMPGTVYYNEVKSEIIDFDLRKYNFFNAVLPTSLPIQEFYKEVGKLWLIKKGKDVI
ncbi:MAG: radical SAM protein [Bacteroidales bacterium]|nr:radical SAM protein [Bacteroidales bacterium]